MITKAFSMSTAVVYQNFEFDYVKEHPNTKAVIKAIEEKDIKTICDSLVNVLETVTPIIHPEINTIKESVKNLGADGVLMSGSGPTVYGLFKNEKIAYKALNKFKKNKSMQFAYLTTIYNRKKG